MSDNPLNHSSLCIPLKGECRVQSSVHTRQLQSKCRVPAQCSVKSKKRRKSTLSSAHQKASKIFLNTIFGNNKAK